VKAARAPIQRPVGARLLVADRGGRVCHRVRAGFVELLRDGDLVIANDAATLPASLGGRHVASGRHLEVRLAGADSFAVNRPTRFSAVLFGLGDYRMRTEDRPLPPVVRASDRLALGPLHATVDRLLWNHPRLVELSFDGPPQQIWEGLARHGRPIQYSHLPARLALWDTWTPIAGLPVAFEPPSAGFMLTWDAVAAMAARRVRFATITHAAGISSTGAPEVDALLPFDEPYRVPASTATAIAEARKEGGRIVAVGTTVVRALEHAAGDDRLVRGGEGLATNRIGALTRLRVVDALFSGVHEPGSSHYELLRAFADDSTLARIDDELRRNGYRTHEFGDSVFIERRGRDDLAERRQGVTSASTCGAASSGGTCT
jgi:S-adenosylmethionine:tRNA ribosyltransferase-isomerase